VAPDARPADTVTIGVVTNRQRDASSGAYSDIRSPELTFERFTISIPPDHRPMRIEWPAGRPDPKKSFAVTERRILPAFELGEAPGAGANGRRLQRKRDIVVFVHGYNNSFEESLFRLAQLAVDGDLEEMPFLFAWPSAASVTGYVADRDAVLYSRDGLVRLLTIIASNRDIGRITIFGHSMGAMLVTEALRQLRLTGRDKAIERLEDVVLAAPDIDIDVFRAQLEVIGPLDPPMTLLVAPDDRALKVSARLAGSRSRVGTRNVQDPRVQELAAAHGVQHVDISKLTAADAIKHDRFIGLVTVLPRMRDEPRPTFAEAGAFVLEPLTAVLRPAHR
jgi:esterase/lipase superfamily enzyme